MLAQKLYEEEAAVGMQSANGYRALSGAAVDALGYPHHECPIHPSRRTPRRRSGCRPEHSYRGGGAS